jgi:Type VI secretion system/phage-baseplate injector OB domain
MATNQFGIYAATVLNTSDPMRLGRVQLMVRSGGHPVSGWAQSCVTPGGSVDAVRVGDEAWAMFEGGDTQYPVFVGVRPK